MLWPGQASSFNNQVCVDWHWKIDVLIDIDIGVVTDGWYLLQIAYSVVSDAQTQWLKNPPRVNILLLEGFACMFAVLEITDMLSFAILWPIPL